jgi:hypothetical protein
MSTSEINFALDSCIDWSEEKRYASRLAAIAHEKQRQDELEASEVLCIYPMTLHEWIGVWIAQFEPKKWPKKKFTRLLTQIPKTHDKFDLNECKMDRKMRQYDLRAGILQYLSRSEDKLIMRRERRNDFREKDKRQSVRRRNARGSKYG